MSAELYPHRDLLGLAGLERHQIGFLLDEADARVGSHGEDKPLAGLTQINAFFENSTRTLLSFEIAGKRLGADVVNMHAAQSSVKKGETLIDTAVTLNAMRADVIVIRHGSSGAVKLIADHVDCPVLNAGDGWHEHPTQGLLDLLTIRRRLGEIAGLTVAIVGDIRHSRVARSNLFALSTLGARVRLCGPATLLPAGLEPSGAFVTTDMDEALDGADVVMMLRVQAERMAGGLVPSAREYRALYGLTAARLGCARPDAIVMHPGPMNRGVEIDSDVADLAGRSVITEQVSHGVAVRMACLDVLTRARRS